ncbi:MAG: hypothetical protein RL757_2235 [Bacteroidota bacterium]|jgi:uncharacterized protein YecT (DUF1311 family)
MKRINWIKNGVLMVALLAISPVFAQQESAEEKAIKKEIKAEVERKVADFKAQLAATDPYSKESEEFMSDTFRIERTLELAIEKDGSTQGMNRAMREAEASYDVLLNKYYKKIMGKLSAKDKITFKEAQRTWVVFRDNEIKVFSMLVDEKYSGGGTIQSNIFSGRVYELTRRRVQTFGDYWLNFSSVD